MGRRRPSARERANRQNAQRSTGPKTRAGKERSSQNALLHGLRAEASRVVPEELAPLVERIAGQGASALELNAASDLVLAQRDVALARLIEAKLMRRVTQLLEEEDGSSLIRDPRLPPLMTKEGRREVAALGPDALADLDFLRRVARLDERAQRRRSEPLKWLRRIERYEMQAHVRRRRTAMRLDQIKDKMATAKRDKIPK